MKVIAITGGIGSGKSVVRRILETLGYPTISSDEVAKKLYFDPVIKRKIIALLGVKAYSKNELNREYIRKFIFSTPENLKIINELIHPHVIAETDRWIKKQNSSLVFKESALIFETQLENHFDFIISISCSDTLKQKRLLKRGLTKEQIALIQSVQLGEEERNTRSDFVIINDEKNSLIQQVVDFIQKISS